MSTPPDPYQIDVRLASRLEEKRARLDAYRPLPPDAVRQIQADLRLLLTHHSTAIEGNTLSLYETRLVLEEGLTLGDHPLREYLEATNHAEAFDFLLTLTSPTEPLTLETILQLHSRVMHKLMPDAGMLRQRPVAIRGALLQLPSPVHVPAALAAWLVEVNTPPTPPIPLVAQHRLHQLHWLVQAAVAHYRFEAIHPFSDGNGRVGRLLLNLMLLRAGYAPALLAREWRVAYLRALRGADLGYYNALINLVGRGVEHALDLYLEVCDAPVYDPYVPLIALAAQSGYSVNYLGSLIRRGHVPAIKRGGRWYSTQAALERYAAEVHAGLRPKGRPPHGSAQRGKYPI
ncbi:MAG: Fic family protein [Chloroflexia bacterium]